VRVAKSVTYIGRAEETEGFFTHETLGTQLVTHNTQEKPTLLAALPNSTHKQHQSVLSQFASELTCNKELDI
jgi:hypothetical protein